MPLYGSSCNSPNNKSIASKKLRLRGLLFGVILVYSVVLLSPFSLTSLVLLHVAVHEEYHRPARAGGVGTEGAVSKAGGDAILDSPGNVSNWVNIVIIQKALVMRQKIGVESEFLDSQVQISTPNQKKPNTYSCCLYNGIMYL